MSKAKEKAKKTTKKKPKEKTAGKTKTKTKTKEKTKAKTKEKPKEKKTAKKPEKKTEEKPKEKPKEKAEKKMEESSVLIGQKPVMRYVVACLTSFNSGAEKVVVKARGRAISRAVDTAELLRRAFLKDVDVEEINIGTEEMARPDRPRSNVSTMEIVLVKKPETTKK